MGEAKQSLKDSPLHLFFVTRQPRTWQGLKSYPGPISSIGGQSAPMPTITLVHHRIPKSKHQDGHYLHYGRALLGRLKVLVEAVSL